MNLLRPGNLRVHGNRSACSDSCSLGIPRILRFALLCVLLICLWSCRGSDGEKGLAPGQVPPILDFETLSGEPYSLESLRGKTVLINFWASWCAPCVAEMPELQALYQELSASDFSIVAIGVDDKPENLAKVQKRFGLTFPIVVDKKGLTKSAFRLVGFPESFLIDKSGKLVMFPDPDSSEPVVRVIGPREWSREPALSVIRGIAQR